MDRIVGGCDFAPLLGGLVALSLLFYVAMFLVLLVIICFSGGVYAVFYHFISQTVRRNFS